MSLFLTIIVVLISLVVLFICALLFFGGLEIIENFKGIKGQLSKLNSFMEEVVAANSQDHKSIKEKLLKHDDEFIKVHGRIDSHINANHKKDNQ